MATRNRGHIFSGIRIFRWVEGIERLRIPFINLRTRRLTTKRQTKGKTQKEINMEALANFEREMKKLKAYFRRRGLSVIVYTDNDLQNYDAIFDELSEYMTPAQIQKQLEFQAMEDFLSFKHPK